MNKKFTQFALPVLAFAFVGAAQANTSMVVEFGPDGSGFFVTGLNEMFPVNTALPEFANSGYANVAKETGNQWVAGTNREVSPVTFSSFSGELFDLNSVWLAGAWGSQTLTIVGHVNGVATYTTTIDVTMTAKQYEFTGFLGIDSFTISTGDNFVRDPSAPFTGKSWAMASVNVTVVPEPETYAMLLAGLGIVGAIARRRQRS